MKFRAFCVLCFTIAATCGAADWRVPQATVRFGVKLGSRPTHASAGYFVQLPDGGILPKPFPKTQVFCGDKPVKSYVLWQNPESGLGVVFETPSQGGEVAIYLSPARQLSTWTPASGITPSAILCTHPGRGSKADALALAKLGAVPWSVYYRNRPGERRAPLSLPGDLSGRSGPCALYMLAYVATSDPGKTWIAPLAFGGGTEVRVDGKPVVPAKRNNKAGGTGQDSYTQVGHGGHDNRASHGVAADDIVVIAQQGITLTGGNTAGVTIGAYAQIGNGGYNADGTKAGDISVTSTVGDITLDGGTQAGTYAQIGHGGYLADVLGA